MANTALIGIAGVHYVVSELCRRGMVALPTVRNMAAYDIVALNEEGSRHANIQVKTSSKCASFFPMPPPEHVRAGVRDFYVLVRWREERKAYEAFLLTGRQAREAVNVSLWYQEFYGNSNGRKSRFPVINIGRGYERSRSNWSAAWEAWKL
ncbi:MAG: hypothetical protein K0Q43_667 [Ramlibacter sp.]|jgi:hypothetical protein|nr:hypothetical protein [Ramlibacter sp.]